ncbi:MAG: TetR/AcrR family transcriptional regulator [Stenotrophobium sp.]
MPAILTAAEEQATRQRFVDAALGIYRRQGLDALSFRSLALATGLSHTLPYRYFEHKEALLVAMRLDCTQRFEAFVRQHEAVDAPLLSRIRSIAAAYVEFVQRNRAEYLLVFSTDQPPPDQCPELLAARRSLFDHVTGVIALCVQAGKLQGDALQITHEFWVALHGLMTLHVANQLVHGCTLEELVGPLIDRLLVQSDQVSPVKRPSRAAAKSRR